MTGRKRTVFEGDTFVSNEGVIWSVEEYVSADDITVRSENGTIRYINSGIVKSGALKDYNHKSVLGVGWLGDGKYKKATHKRTYDLWIQLLRSDHVAPEWHCFQNFCQWYVDNKSVGVLEYITCSLLDPDNKVFSPDKAMLVPFSVHSFLLEQPKQEGVAVGVKKVKDKYRARVNWNLKDISLGTFTKEEDAFNAYVAAKLNLIKDLKINEHVKELVRNKLNNKYKTIAKNRGWNYEKEKG